MSKPVMPEALAWQTRSELNKRSFAVDLESGKLREGPNPVDFWGPAEVSVSSEQVVLTWHPRSESYRAKPEIRLFVDLRNGYAFEAFSVEHGPRVGNKYGEMVRNGICEVFTK